MKCLFDQNLSRRLVYALAELYPDSTHVVALGLDRSSDTEIWEYAKSEGFIIVSKDSDFYQRSLLLGQPPKVIWLHIGNCSTETIADLLRDRADTVRRFDENDSATFLILTR